MTLTIDCLIIDCLVILGENEKKSSIGLLLTSLHFLGEIDELVFCQFFLRENMKIKPRYGKTAIVTNGFSLGCRVKNETCDT